MQNVQLHMLITKIGQKMNELKQTIILNMCTNKTQQNVAMVTFLGALDNGFFLGDLVDVVC